MTLRYAGKAIMMEGKKVHQVAINKAKEAYENGKIVWIHPCNMRIDNPWQKPYSFSKEGVEKNAYTLHYDFEQVVFDYKYYNCNREMGKYPIFFVEVEK